MAKRRKQELLQSIPPWWRGDRLPWDMARQLVSELNKLYLWEEKWTPKEIKRAVKRGSTKTKGSNLLLAFKQYVPSLSVPDGPPGRSMPTRKSRDIKQGIDQV